MEKKKTWLLGALSGMIFTNFFWNPIRLFVDANFNNWLEANGYNEVWTLLETSQVAAVLGYLTGPFGLGFSLSGVIFAFWDPVSTYLTKGSRNAVRERAIALSKEWDDLARQIYSDIDADTGDTERWTTWATNEDKSTERQRWKEMIDSNNRESGLQFQRLNRLYLARVHTAEEQILHFGGTKLRPFRNAPIVNHFGYRDAAEGLAREAASLRLKIETNAGLTAVVRATQNSMRQAQSQNPA